MNEIDDLADHTVAYNIDELGRRIHQDNVDRGWWELPAPATDIVEGIAGKLADDSYVSKGALVQYLQDAIIEARRVPPPNDGEKLMLTVTEIAETVEGLRHNNPASDKIPEYTAAEEEIADAIIRLLDLAAYHKWRIGPAIIAKLAMNRTRGYRHGGKKF